MYTARRVQQQQQAGTFFPSEVMRRCASLIFLRTWAVTGSSSKAATVLDCTPAAHVCQLQPGQQAFMQARMGAMQPAGSKVRRAG